MDNILARTIAGLALIGIAIGFMSNSSTESSKQSLDSDQPDSNEVPPLTGNPYQDTRIVGGKRRKKTKKRRKGH